MSLCEHPPSPPLSLLFHLCQITPSLYLPKPSPSKELAHDNATDKEPVNPPTITPDPHKIQPNQTENVWWRKTHFFSSVTYDHPRHHLLSRPFPSDLLVAVTAVCRQGRSKYSKYWQWLNTESKYWQYWQCKYNPTKSEDTANVHCALKLFLSCSHNSNIVEQTKKTTSWQQRKRTTTTTNEDHDNNERKPRQKRTMTPTTKTTMVE